MKQSRRNAFAAIFIILVCVLFIFFSRETFQRKNFSHESPWLFSDLRQIFSERVNFLFPYPSQGLLLGILIGERNALPYSLSEAFKKVGLTHLTAMSGYNISLVSVLVFSILIWLGLERKQAFYFSLLAIMFFTIFVGAGSSVLRASLMGSLILVLRHVGRRLQKYLLLLYTAAFLAMFNPFILLDVGFQLSFAATIGIFYIEPILSRRFPSFFLKNYFHPTFAALLAVEPIILYYFGSVSFIAPISNALIIPLIPVIMFLGFSAVMISFVSVTLGKIFAIAPWLLLVFMEKMTFFFAKLPFASIQTNSPAVRSFAFFVWGLVFFWICGKTIRKKISVFVERDLKNALHEHY